MTSSYSVHDSPFFELNCPFTTYEAVKMVLLLPLVPLRLLLVLVGVCTMALLCSLACIGGLGQDQPLPIQRRRLVLLGKEALQLTLWAFGVHVRVQGRDNIQRAHEVGWVFPVWCRCIQIQLNSFPLCCTGSYQLSASLSEPELD